MEGVWAAAPWAFVVIGGPLILGAVLAWVKLRSAKAPDSDPATPSDDPSKGMTGHD